MGTQRKTQKPSSETYLKSQADFLQHSNFTSGNPSYRCSCSHTIHDRFSFKSKTPKTVHISMKLPCSCNEKALYAPLWWPFQDTGIPRHTAGSVAHHPNEVNTAIKWVTQVLGAPVHVKVMFTLYCEFIKCVIAWCLKSNICTLILKYCSCPGWCGSVDWVPACEPKGCQFNSQSGHMPRLQARSPVGGLVSGNQSTYLLRIDPSLPLSFPSPLSKNK